MLAGMLDAALCDLNALSPGITASAVLTLDGLVLAGSPPGSWADDQMGAVSACLFSAGTRLTEKAQHGQPEQIIILCAAGHVLVVPVGAEAIMVVLASPDTDMGLVATKVQQTAATVMAELACPIFMPHPPKQ